MYSLQVSLLSKRCFVKISTFGGLTPVSKTITTHTMHYIPKLSPQPHDIEAVGFLTARKLPPNSVT